MMHYSKRFQEEVASDNVDQTFDRTWVDRNLGDVRSQVGQLLVNTFVAHGYESVCPLDAASHSRPGMEIEIKEEGIVVAGLTHGIAPGSMDKV